MSGDNGNVPRPYSRALTIALEWAPDRLPEPQPVSCLNPGARAGNRWLPLFAAFDAYRVQWREAAEAKGVPPSMDDRLLTAILTEIDALQVQVAGHPAGPADSWLYDGVEAGDLLLAIWSASRLGEVDRGKSVAPSP